ncbi:hypothetical protein [Chroococcidiopsis sp.]|uniref:hypothetical protein n=1 Tax=Chroococcidiopsis sp. TaxID=3088168 RepID=UPI003F402777
MSELTLREKQLLAQMEADEEKAEAEERNKPESDRVQPMPFDKTDFPIGIPDVESTDEPNAG